MLTDFLLARIEEDEARAYEVHNTHDCDSVNPPGYPCDCGVPARIAADCAAKRRLVAEAEDWRWDRDDAPPDPKSDTVLELLALPYADHPDYDDSWRP